MKNLDSSNTYKYSGVPWLEYVTGGINIRFIEIPDFDSVEAGPEVQDGFLWSDTDVQQRHSTGTTIGMTSIKK
jgi:hypothetical protein